MSRHPLDDALRTSEAPQEPAFLAGVERLWRGPFTIKMKMWDYTLGARRSDEAVAQSRADRVHHHYHDDGHEEDGRGGGIVDHPEIRLEVEADAARADEAKHGRRADVGLQAVEDVREKEREDLRQD